MYIRMYAFTYYSTYVGISLYVCMHVCVNVCMYVCNASTSLLTYTLWLSAATAKCGAVAVNLHVVGLETYCLLFLCVGYLHC